MHSYFQGLLKGGHDFLLTIPEWKPTLKECNKRKDLLFLQLLVDELLNVGEVEDVFLVPGLWSLNAIFICFSLLPSTLSVQINVNVAKLSEARTSLFQLPLVTKPLLNKGSEPTESLFGQH